jgi:hypothetical protein
VFGGMGHRSNSTTYEQVLTCGLQLAPA